MPKLSDEDKANIIAHYLNSGDGYKLIAKEFGEKVYRQVTVDDKKVGKWVVLVNVTKYDERGNDIYEKFLDNDEIVEKWMEYDDCGNMIHWKTSDGYEHWFEIEYDENGKKSTVLTFVKM